MHTGDSSRRGRGPRRHVTGDRKKEKGTFKISGRTRRCRCNGEGFAPAAQMNRRQPHVDSDYLAGV